MEQGQRALNLARKAAGMQPANLTLTMYRLFYKFLPPQCAVFGVNGRCLGFVPIYKAGNDAIRGTLVEYIHELQRATNLDGFNYFTLDHNSCYPRTHHPLISRAHVPVLTNDVCQKGLFTMTFSREPLTHFIAGYGEYTWRVYSGMNGTVSEVKALMKSQGDTPKEIITRILNDEVSWTTNDVMHMAPMSGSFGHGLNKFHFVGRLPDMEQDLQYILRTSGIVTNETAKYVPRRDDIGQHESSNDPLSMRQEMVDFLTTNHELRRAICYIFNPDYECFGYDINACLDGSALLLHA